MVRTIKSTKNNDNGQETYKRIEGDDKYLSNIFSYDHFKLNDSIVIQSSTGTGKTYSCFEYISTYMKEYKDCRMLSICAKRSLCTDHYNYIQNLKNPLHYLSIDEGTKIENYNSVVCVNSLWKYEYSNDFIKKNLILYIDEISIFLLTEMCRNETLDEKLKSTYHSIMRLVNHSHKIIVSQNNIHPVVFDFLSKREMNLNKLFVKNSYINSNGISAYHVKDKETFCKKICNDTKNGFLVACDKKETTKELCNLFLKENPDIEEKVHLITSKTSRDFDASKDIKQGNYYFYSPSIVYGVDFNFPVATNQYIYISGCSVDPEMLYQMAMRTRNMKRMYYYIEKNIKKNKLLYNNLEECKNDIVEKMNSYHRLLSLSSYTDPDDEEFVIVENSYFNIFVNSEYELNKLKSDPKFYFEENLRGSGFTIKKLDTIEADKKLTKLQKERIEEAQEMKLNQESTFDEMMEGKETLTDVIDTVGKGENKEIHNEIISKLLQKSKYINIQTTENMIKYKNLILYDDEYKDSIKSLYFYKTDDIIQLNLKRLSDKTFDCKMLKEHIYKIASIRKLLQKHNIDLFNLNDNKQEINIDKDDKKILKDMRYTKKIFPKTKYELLKFLYVKINILTSSKIIEFVNVSKKGNAGAFHLITDKIKYFMELIKENHLYAYEQRYLNFGNRKKPVRGDEDETTLSVNLFL